MRMENLLKNVLIFIIGFFAVIFLMYFYFSAPGKKKIHSTKSTKVNTQRAADTQSKEIQDGTYDYSANDPLNNVTGNSGTSGVVNGTLKGYIDIYDKNSNITHPASGIDVILIGSGGVFVTSTDPYGNYEVSVPGGDYNLAINLPGIKKYERSISVNPDSVVVAPSISLTVNNN